MARDLVPLEQFFRNLILGEKNELKSRYLLIGLNVTQKKLVGRLSEKGCQKRVVRKPRQKTSDKLLVLLKGQSHLSQMGMAAALGISRQAIQKHIKMLKAAGRLCRIGPDKGGYWKVV